MLTHKSRKSSLSYTVLDHFAALSSINHTLIRYSKRVNMQQKVSACYKIPQQNVYMPETFQSLCRETKVLKVSEHATKSLSILQNTQTNCLHARNCLKSRCRKTKVHKVSERSTKSPCMLKKYPNKMSTCWKLSKVYVEGLKYTK